MVRKQTAARYYPRWATVVAANFAGFPLLVVEVCIFGNLMYWMTANVAEAKEFFVFFAVLVRRGPRAPRLALPPNACFTWC